jgi:SAM-dependent methyltransferase
VDSTCPLDGATLQRDGMRLRDNRYALDRAVEIAWCPSCGLGVTIDPPSADELAELYAACYVDETAPPQVPRHGALAGLWHRLNGSLPVTDADVRPPVLDVGCNTGETLVVLRARGIDGVGLEPNPAAAAAARAKGLEVIEAPIESAQLPAAAFESAILSQVLEHVHEPGAVLDRIRPSLRDGARIHVVVPNAGSIWRRVFGEDWVHWHVPFHLWHHTRTSLELLLRQSGFAVESVRSVTPGEWLLMSLAARRNARRDVRRLTSFRGRFAARLVVAPLGRLGDLSGRGDALYCVARKEP